MISLQIGTNVIPFGCREGYLVEYFTSAEVFEEREGRGGARVKPDISDTVKIYDSIQVLAALVSRRVKIVGLAEKEWEQW